MGESLSPPRIVCTPEGKSEVGDGKKVGNGEKNPFGDRGNSRPAGDGSGDGIVNWEPGDGPGKEYHGCGKIRLCDGIASPQFAGH